MASRETLNSRLRVLIAKAFRAEKLYSSMRNAYAVRPVNAGEIANDLRAREWQRVHNDLRTALNDALSLSSSTALAARVASLKSHFASQGKDSALSIDKETEQMVAAARRHEFAHTSKLALDLVQQKARMQACQVVAEELSDILQASGRAEIEADSFVWDSNPAVAAQNATTKTSVSAAKTGTSNVIPFRRVAGSGKY